MHEILSDPASRLRRLAPLAILALLIASAVSCTDSADAPRSFELIELERAQAKLRNGSVILIEVVDGRDSAPRSAEGTIRWELPAEPVPLIPPATIPQRGEILLIASYQRVGVRAAAAASRIRNLSVFLCILPNAEQRTSLYALAGESKEIESGRDS